MPFCNILKLLREQRGLPQKAIADFLGITRQAVASYELGRREPGFGILLELADYFGVSVDYLLGRTGCKDINAYIIGQNIRLVRGNLTYKQISEDISLKVGVMVFPEMLKMYESGECIPCTGTIKILARYASVHEVFFYSHNTAGMLEMERELFKTKSVDNSTVQ